MVDLSSLVVRLIADTSRYRRDLDRAANDLNGFQRIANSVVGKVGIAAAAAAGAVTVAMVALGKSAIDAADQMNDLSKATGISTEALSQLQFAAEQSGTDLEGLVTGLRKFTSQATDAAAKAGPARDAFKLIGVSVTDSAGKLKDTETLLLDVAEQFSQYKDGAAKAAAAQDLFGKSGATLIPFLNAGRSGIQELKEEADRLGLTLRGGTAQAADDFNDNLSKLKAQLGGLGLQIADRFLPALIDITKALSDLLAKKSDLSGFFDALASGFRVVAYVAVATADAFTDVGKLIGGFAAYVAQVAQGNFAEAARLDEEFKKDAIAREEETSRTLARIWGDRAETEKKLLGPRRLGSYLSEAQQYANRNRTGLERPLKEFPVAAEAKKAVDELQEVDIKIQKITLPEDYYKDLQEETMTGLERAYAEFRKKSASLEVLRIEAQIDPINYEARKKEIEKGLKEDLERLKEPVEKANEYQIQAARNTQDIIANTFEGLATGADISAKSILKSFGSMIVRLAAQAAAANLAGKLFGAAGGGAEGSTGWVGAALGALGFGGTRDSGGRGRAGMAYAIGTGAQPELFVPDSAGTFIPAGAGGSVTNNFTIVAEQPLSRRTQLQIAAAAARGVERANRRNN